jgi:ankyrin repeat protein
MKSNNFIDTTCDDYYINPYKFINNIETNNNNILNTNTEINLNLIIKTLTSIIMSNDEIINDEIINDEIINDENIKDSKLELNKNDNFIIFKFIANNDITGLKKILSKNYNLINIQDGDGDTALHISIFLSNYEACKILINNKANLLIKDKWGQIPLHRICFTLKDKNTLKIINLIIGCKEKNICNIVDKYNNTPLHLVIKYILKNNIIIDKHILSIIYKLSELTDLNIVNNDGLSVNDLINLIGLSK